MFKRLNDMFEIQELKQRIVFTIMLLIVYRIGSHITTPGVNVAALAEFFRSGAGGVLGLYDFFVGGNLANATIFALGIMPYISASIILQLLQPVVPYLERLSKEGEEGRRKINQYTRYGTVALALVQSVGISIFLETQLGVVTNPGPWFTIMTMLTMTAGTVFVMWLGEQITERGIGNGISLIIFVGIVARYPADIINTVRSVFVSQTLNIFVATFLLAVMIAVVALTVLITQGQRRIPVQYARRVVGRKMLSGRTTHLPLRINTAGVIPIIFAQSIIMLPSSYAALRRDSEFAQDMAFFMRPGGPTYIILYTLIIIFFAYFYTAVVFNPMDVAESMRKNGGFIPGIRPGKKTAEFIDRVLSRITLPGAIFLAFIAILPDLLIARANVPFYFGGTGLLIVVGVALDTLQQVESHLLMRHYDGFLKKGRLRGRTGF
jgi:preprotein translocase subunit SecY